MPNIRRSAARLLDPVMLNPLMLDPLVLDVLRDDEEMTLRTSDERDREAEKLRAVEGGADASGTCVLELGGSSGRSMSRIVD